MTKDYYLDLANDIHAIQNDKKRSRVSLLDLCENNDVGVLSNEIGDNNLSDVHLAGLSHEQVPVVDICNDSVDEDIYSKEFEINPSPLNPERFKVWLEGYDEFLKAELLHNLTEGIRVPSLNVCDDNVQIPLNHASAYTF